MEVITDIAKCRHAVRAAQRAGRRVGLVPTMGALHEGHLSLVRASRDRCDVTAVTIFVNPTQFALGEDLENYPRTLDTDLGLCRQAGVDIVFTPPVDAMYPGQDLTTVHVDKLVALGAYPGPISMIGQVCGHCLITNTDGSLIRSVILVADGDLVAIRDSRRSDHQPKNECSQSGY